MKPVCLFYGVILDEILECFTASCAFAAAKQPTFSELLTFLGHRLQRMSQVKDNYMQALSNHGSVFGSCTSMSLPQDWPQLSHVAAKA